MRGWDIEVALHAEGVRRDCLMFLLDTRWPLLAILSEGVR